jgi:nickel-dependent lactate racemase
MPTSLRRIMRIDLPYRNRKLGIELPDDTEIIEPNEKKVPGSPAELIRQAIEKPLDSPNLDRFFDGAEHPLVIVNDGTRPTPTSAVLDIIGDRLAACGARFIVATGAHRAPTEDEYHFIFGKSYGRFRGKTEAHDARDKASLVFCGSTRAGTPLWLNRRVLEADRILVIGSVEPHYFAGYTGGRKAFLPGVAGYESIQANHKLALEPQAHSLALDENPVHRDLEDALSHIKAPVFSVMTVLDKGQQVVCCTAGDLRASFRAAVRAANEVFAVKLRRRFDVVISVARSPMDINLYQAQKAIDNGALAVADGGVLILVASCWDGIGDRAYLDLLGSASSPQDALDRIAAGYKLGYHKAAKIAEAAKRIRLVAYSELDGTTLKKAFIEKTDSLQKSVDTALANRGPGAKVAILSDGTLTVPIVE